MFLLPCINEIEIYVKTKTRIPFIDCVVTKKKTAENMMDKMKTHHLCVINDDNIINVKYHQHLTSKWQRNK